MTGSLRRDRRFAALLAVAAVSLLLVPPGAAGASASAGSTLATPAAPPAHVAAPRSPSAQPVAEAASVDLPLSPSSAGSVVRTVYLNYNSSTVGNFPSAVWDWAAGVAAVDPSTGDLWIPETPVSLEGIRAPAYAPALVYDPVTNQTVTVPELANASALAYDPVNDLFYATRPLANDVVAFDPQTERVVGSPIPVGGQPVDIVFDPVSGDLFVANNATANLTVINGTTGAIVQKGIAVGNDPVSLADDTVDGKLFVANSASLFVSVLDTSTLAADPVIPSAKGPTTVSYSSATDVLAVGIPGSLTLDLYDAATQAVASLAAVGTGVSSVTTTPGGDYFVVANGTGDFLDTVLASTASIATFGPRLPTGPDPLRLTGGLSGGTVYAWSAIKRAISDVDFSTASDREISPDLGVEAADMAFDPGSDRVFVSDAGNDSLAVVNASSLATAAPPLWLPSVPLSLADDPSAGIVYAGYDGGIAAIDATNDTVVSSVHGGNASGNNTDLLVDLSSGRLWDVNQVHGLESFSLPGLESLGTVGRDSGYRVLDGMALDPATDDLFVVNVTASSLTEFNGSTGAVIGSPLTGITGLTSVAFDSADQELYALGRSLWVVDPSSDSLVAGPIAIAPHTVAWSVVFDPSRNYLYIPSNDSLNPAWPGNVTVIDGSSVAASEGSYVAFAVGQLPIDVAVVTLPGSRATGSSELWVGNYISGTISVVASPPSISSFGAAPDPIDVGATTDLEVGFDGGAGPSTVTYLGLPGGCATENLTVLPCSPTSAGSFPITVDVVDSLGENTSATTVLSVSPAFTVQLTVESSPAGEVDLGTPFEVAATGIGGTGPYNYTWSLGDGATGWGTTVSHVYAQTGQYLVTVVAHDAGGGISGNSTLVTVVAPVAIVLRATPRNVTDVNVSVNLTAEVTGGTTPGVGNWTLGDGTIVNGTTVRHAYNRSGVYFATYDYRDASGSTASEFLRIVVNPSPSAKFSFVTVPSGSAISPGTPIDFNSTITGGTAPYTVVWGFDDGSYGYGLATQHAYAQAGTYAVTLFVVDAVGGAWNTTFRLTVASSPANSSLGVPFGSGLLLGLLVGAALAAVLLLAAARPRRRPPAAPPTAYVPPEKVDEGPEWAES